MQILNDTEINQKIDRLAFQILENKFAVKQLIFIGVNSNGLAFAKLLQQQYDKISDNASVLATLTINPSDPLEDEIVLVSEVKNLKSKHLIIVDDVANTGRTIFYALKPILNYLPKCVEVAVLIDRKHKMFPIKVDYVGLSLATTLKENIVVDIKKKGNKSAFLQ